MSDSFYSNMIGGGFRYKRVDLSASLIARKKFDGSLGFYSQFKGHEKWNSARKSKFIESTLLGIPSNSIFCEENNYGEWVVLDGIERLVAICDFLTDSYPLRNLNIFSHLNGLYFSQLSFKDRNIISDRYYLNFIIISYDTQPYLKLEFLKRIHSGDSNFNPQSARNYAYPESTVFLKELQEILRNSLHLSIVTGNDFFSIDGVDDVEIDCFILYLICLVFVKHEIIGEPSGYETIVDLLDRTTIILTEQKNIHDGLYNYISDLVIKIIEFYPYSTLFINGVKDKNNDYNKEGISMERFVFYFSRALNSKFYQYDYDKKPPKYYDLGRSSSFIYKELQGIKRKQ